MGRTLRGLHQALAIEREYGLYSWVCILCVGTIHSAGRGLAVVVVRARAVTAAK
jgi:hypothetical protein